MPIQMKWTVLTMVVAYPFLSLLVVPETLGACSVIGSIWVEGWTHWMAGAFANNICRVVYIIPVCGIVSYSIVGQSMLWRWSLWCCVESDLSSSPSFESCSHELVILPHLNFFWAEIFHSTMGFLPRGVWKKKKRVPVKIVEPRPSGRWRGRAVGFAVCETKPRHSPAAMDVELPGLPALPGIKRAWILQPSCSV